MIISFIKLYHFFSIKFLEEIKFKIFYYKNYKQNIEFFNKIKSDNRVLSSRKNISNILVIYLFNYNFKTLGIKQKLIKDYFKLINFKLPEINKIIELLLNKNENYEGNIIHILSKNNDEIDINNFYKLNSLCYMLGYFEILLYLRENFIFNLLSKKNISKNKENLIYYFEKNDKSIILDIIKNFEQKNRSYNSKIYNPSIACNFFFDKDVKLKLNLKKNDQLFENLIKDKSIAVVGPSKNELQLGNEIDNFDLIVRMKMISNTSLKNYKVTGKKTDIIYYNSSSIDNLNKNKLEILHDTILQNKIKFCCFKNTKPIFYKINKFIDCRKFFIFPWKKHPFNFLQNIILDLILFKPRKIKVFNSDFYLGDYDENYDNLDLYKSHYKDLINLRRSFATHDLLMNYRITRNLYKNKVIDLDYNLKNILDLNEKNFLEKIKEKFFI